MSLEQFGQQVIEFVRVHESWAAPIVFALAFAESLAFLSLVLPSWAALVGIGAMIRAGGIDFVPLWISGALGAAFGDWLSYWIGARFKDPIAGTWPFSQHPHLLARGEALIKNWGVLAIVVGRFSGPLRASVPIVAGILSMPYWPFQLANFSSAFVWVAVLLTLGDVGAAISSWLWNHLSSWMRIEVRGDPRIGTQPRPVFVIPDGSSEFTISLGAKLGYRKGSNFGAVLHVKFSNLRLGASESSGDAGYRATRSCAFR